MCHGVVAHRSMVPQVLLKLPMVSHVGMEDEEEVATMAWKMRKKRWTQRHLRVVLPLAGRKVLCATG